MKKKKRFTKGEDPHDKSRVPVKKGQGLSEGYGGSAGAGAGACGPESKPETPSPSLPSKETIAKVLR